MDIPRSVWEYITSHVPGELVDQAWEIRGYLVACSTRDEPITLTASFRGMNGVAAEVEMPFRHMLVPALESLRSGNYNDTAPLVIDGTEQCVFTPTPVDDDFGEFGIGDPVFRSSYVFFNMEEYTISLAPASYNTDESNLVPIGEGDGRTGNYPSGLGSKKGVARPWWA